jgi:hypothetical protein
MMIFQISVGKTGTDPSNHPTFKNCFKLYWSKQTTVAKQVELISLVFWMVAVQDMWWLGGWRNQN